jgi:hypothetical protein
VTINDAVTATNAAPVEPRVLAREEGPQESEQREHPDGQQRRGHGRERDGQSAANGATWLQYRQPVGTKPVEQPC